MHPKHPLMAAALLLLAAGNPVAQETTQETTRVRARLQSFSPTASGGVTWSGRLASDSSGYFALAAREGAVAGTILHHGKLYRLRGTDFSNLVVSACDAYSLPVCGNEATPPERAGDGARQLASPETPVARGATMAKAGSNTSQRGLPAGQSTTQFPGTPGGTTSTRVDVLVVWTQEAEDAAGGPASIQALIDLAMLETQMGYDNSEVNISLRLVASSKVTYVESGSMALDLDRLRGTEDPFLDEVHQLRNASGADVVTMLVADDTKAGRSYNYGVLPPGMSFAESAFNLVSQGSATGVLAFAHELGHNFGLDHDRPNTLNTPSLPYAFGFWLEDATHRTIMSLERLPNQGIRIPYYSNPNLTFLGLQLGVPAPSPASADCARALNENATTIAGWRSEVTPLLIPSGHSPGLSSMQPSRQAGKSARRRERRHGR